MGGAWWRLCFETSRESVSRTSPGEQVLKIKTKEPSTLSALDGTVFQCDITLRMAFPHHKTVRAEFTHTWSLWDSL